MPTGMPTNQKLPQTAYIRARLKDGVGKSKKTELEFAEFELRFMTVGAR